MAVAVAAVQRPDAAHRPEPEAGAHGAGQRDRAARARHSPGRPGRLGPDTGRHARLLVDRGHQQAARLAGRRRGPERRLPPGLAGTQPADRHPVDPEPLPRPVDRLRRGRGLQGFRQLRRRAGAAGRHLRPAAGHHRPLRGPQPPALDADRPAPALGGRVVMSAVAYTAGYRAFPFNDFSGGLNLRDKADTVGDSEAIDLLNVTFNERGAILQRDGYADLTPNDLANRVDSLAAYYNAAGVRQLVAGCGTRLDVLDSNGTVVNAQAGMAGGPWTFARFGDPTHEYMYAANGADVLQRWDGSAWTSGTNTATVNGTAGVAMPRGAAVCITASTPGSTSGTNASNRMIVTAFGALTNGGPGGAVSTPSRVYESN